MVFKGKYRYFGHLMDVVFELTGYNNHFIDEEEDPSFVRKYLICFQIPHRINFWNEFKMSRRHINGPV